MIRLASVAVVLLLLFASRSNAMASPQAAAPMFGTCAWWNDPLPGTSPPEGGINRLYKLGFAQGVVLGMDGSVWATINDYRAGVSPTAVADLVNTFMLGFRPLLGNPAAMQVGFDAKCADARNSAVWLPKLGLLVALETGGTKPERIEAALQVLRRTQIPTAKEIVEALLAR